MKEMLRLVDIQKTYEGKPLLRGVNFTLAEGETICLLGASGSGKSTLLRIIAGLEAPEGGAVLWEGKDLAAVPVWKRNFGLMFQDYALFPHLTVRENVAFGLEMQKQKTEEISRSVAEALAQVGMAGFEHRRVTDLSGGEQQRVALARALVPHPRLLMLDEPLGALDHRLKEQLLQELRRLLHETTLPAIYVTHDQEEAFSLADRILILRDGLIHQEGKPAEVYRRPRDPWVARFLGFDNFVEGTARQEGEVLETQWGEFPAQPNAPEELAEGTAVLGLIHDRIVQLAQEQSADPGIPVQVTDSVFKAGQYFVTVRTVNGVESLWELPASQPYEAGQRLKLTFPPGGLLLYPPEVEKP